MNTGKIKNEIWIPIGETASEVFAKLNEIEKANAVPFSLRTKSGLSKKSTVTRSKQTPKRIVSTTKIRDALHISAVTVKEKR